MPAFYTDTKCSLYDQFRDPSHQPPTLVDLGFEQTDLKLSDGDVIERNNAIMYRQVVCSKTAQSFMGDPYHAGDNPDPGAGALELMPHNTVHRWIGDPRQPDKEDMGILYSAAQDPIFYAHHSNVDRMLDIWRSLGRENFTDSDWLNASFLFYDENGQLVTVKAKQAVDACRLRFTYQDVEIPWLNARPTPKGVKSKTLKLFSGTPPQFPVTLGSLVSVTVKRPTTKRSKKEEEEEEEVLVVEGIEFDRDLYVKFDVFVNTPVEEGVEPIFSEFAGSFVSLPRRRQANKVDNTLKTNFKTGITDLLEELDCEGDESVVVTLVPKSGKGKIKIAGVRIELSS